MINTDNKNKKIGNGLAWISIFLSLITLILLWYVFQLTITKAMSEESVGLIYFWDALSLLAFLSGVLAFFKLRKNKHNRLIAFIGMLISGIAIGFCIAATIGIRAIQEGVAQALA